MSQPDSGKGSGKSEGFQELHNRDERNLDWDYLKRYKKDKDGDPSGEFVIRDWKCSNSSQNNGKDCSRQSNNQGV